MASEYLKWKYRDVKSDEPPPPLTGWPKVKNWLHYHIIYILAVAVVLGVAGTMIWNVLGIGQTKPDYIAAFVGRRELPEETMTALRDAIAALGEDVNGDGQVAVELRAYISGTGQSAESAGYAMAAAVTLSADINSGESVFFITDDPLELQVGYQILADGAGRLPEAEDYTVEDRALRLEDLPAFDGVEGRDGLWLGRRGFYDPDQEREPEADGALWEAMTKGARSE